MKAATLILALGLLPRLALADLPDLAGGPGVFFSRDSEGFAVDRYHLFAMPSYRSGSELTGARISHHRYSQNGWREEGEQAALVHRRGHPGDPESLQLEAGIFRQGGHQMLSLEGNYGRQIADRTRVEVFGSRDWVETAPALQRGVHFTFLGAALEQGVGEHVTLVGLAGSQAFSDDNRRDHLRLRAIYQPFLDSGLTLQIRHSFFHSTRQDVDGAYFNPENYRRTLFGVGYRQRLQGWVGMLTLGSGPQKIDGADDRRSDLVEFSLESPRQLASSFRLRGGYSRAAGFNGPDYDYRYLQAEWLFSF